jgi:Domain of unknown function DUF29
MTASTPRYDEDFYAWTQQQAALLRAEKFQDLDIMNLAEELESLGARDHRELRRRLQRLVTHLLKWRYQPARRQTGHSWRATIRTQRQEIAEILEQSPSLRRAVPEALSARYALAREHASAQTRLPLGTAPGRWSRSSMTRSGLSPLGRRHDRTRSPRHTGTGTRQRGWHSVAWTCRAGCLGA